MAITVERLVAEIEANPEKAIAALESFGLAVEVATKDETKHITIKVDQSELDKLEGAFDSVTRGSNAASVGMGRFGNSSSMAGRAFGVFRMILVGIAFGAIYAALTMLAGGLSAITGAAAGAMSALAPLGGLVLTLIPAMGMLGGSIFALVAGLSGIGKAYSAMSNAAGGGARSTFNLAQRTRDLAAAQRAAKEAARGLARAQRELADAQKKWKEAPADAAKELQRSARNAEEAMLNEERAALALAEAQKALADAQGATADSAFKFTKEVDAFTGKTYEIADAGNDAVQSALDQQRAMIDLRQAEIDYTNAQEDNAETQKKNQELQKKGIKGTDAYISAQRRLVEAQEGLASAQDAVASSQDRIAEAMKRMNPAVAGGVNSLANAMKNLSPAGKSFVNFLHKEFVPSFKQVRMAAQEGLLPALQEGLAAMIPRMSEIAAVTGAFAETIGEATGGLLKFWSSSKRSSQLTRVFFGLNGATGDLLKSIEPLSRVLVSLTEAATPLIRSLSQGLNRQLEKLADWMETIEGKTKMADYFNEVLRMTRLWGSFLSPVASLLTSVSKAARPLATWMLESMATYFRDLADRAKSAKGQLALGDFFDRQKAPIQEFIGLLKDIVKTLFTSGEGGEESGFVRTTKALRKDAIPALERLMDTLDKSDFGPKMAEVVANILDLFTAFTENDGALSIIADGFNGIADALGVLSDKTDGKSTEAIMKFLTFLALYKFAKAVAGMTGISAAASGLASVGAGMLPTGGGKRKKGAARKAGSRRKPGPVKGAMKMAGSGAKTVGKGAAAGAGVAVGSSVKAFGAVTKAAGVATLAVGKWAASMIAKGALAAASFAKSAGKIILTYAWMAAKAMANAIRMALSWFIALGPIGWAIAAIALVVFFVIKYWDKIKEYTKKAWEWVWGKIKWVGGKILEFFKKYTLPGLIWTHFDKIKKTIGGAWDWVKTKTSGVIDWFKKVPERMKNAMSGMWDGLKSGFRGALNWLIDKWNAFTLKLVTPDWLKKVPGVPDSMSFNTPNIPRLYTGGSVKAGQQYIVGEKRAELFVPSVDGKIMPRAVPDSNLSRGSGGISAAQLESIVQRIQANTKPDVNVEQVFNEKVDPKHMSSELVWKIAS